MLGAKQEKARRRRYHITHDGTPRLAIPYPFCWDFDIIKGLYSNILRGHWYSALSAVLLPFGCSGCSEQRQDAAAVQWAIHNAE